MALTEEQYKEYYPKTYKKAMQEEWGGKVQAAPSHKTELTDLAKAGKSFDPSEGITFEQHWERYKSEHGLAEYGESALSTGRAYYEVPVTASTGEAAKMGMTEAVYEKYLEAKREEQASQMPYVQQQTYTPEEMGYGTATTRTITEAERKKAEKAAEAAKVSGAWESGLMRYVREPLGTDYPGAPPSAKFLESTLTGVGAPLVFAFGDPKVRETTLSYAAKYPAETAGAIGKGLVSWPLTTGASIVGKVRKGETGYALGEFATAFTFVGLTAGAAKGATKITRPPSTLKGAAGAVKPKLKTTGLARALAEIAAKKVIRKRWLKLTKKGKLKGMSYSEFELRYMKQLKESPTKMASFEKSVITEMAKTEEAATGQRVYVETPQKVVTEVKFENIAKPLTKQKLSSRTLTLSAMASGTLTQTERQRQKEALSFKMPSLTAQTQSQRQAQRQAEAQAQKSAQAEAQKDKQRERAFMASFSGLTGPAGKTPGRPRQPRAPRPGVPFFAGLPPMPKSFIPKRKKRPKKKDDIYRKLMYTPSLGGVLGYVKPIKMEPVKLTGLKMRPLIITKKKKRRKKT